MNYRIMDELDRTEELLHKGLKEINDKGDLNASNLELLGEALDAIKDLYEISGKGMNMIEEYGYSQRWEDPRRGYPNGGHSYREESYGGHSRNSDAYLDELHQRMNMATSENEREIIRKMIMEREGR